MKDKMYGSFLKSISILVLVCILIWAFYIVKTPQYNRELRIDQKRINHVYQARRAVNMYYNSKQVLPNSMENLLKPESIKLRNKLSFFIQSSKKKYFDLEYQVKTQTKYQICTLFLHSSDQREAYKFLWENRNQKKWKHPSGKYCFTFSVDIRQNKK